MQTADVHEDDDDTDEEDIKTNLFKAAEQEVKFFPGKNLWFISPMNNWIFHCYR